MKSWWWRARSERWGFRSYSLSSWIQPHLKLVKFELLILMRKTSFFVFIILLVLDFCLLWQKIQMDGEAKGEEFKWWCVTLSRKRPSGAIIQTRKPLLPKLLELLNDERAIPLKTSWPALRHLNLQDTRYSDLLRKSWGMHTLGSYVFSLCPYSCPQRVSSGSFSLFTSPGGRQSWEEQTQIQECTCTPHSEPVQWRQCSPSLIVGLDWVCSQRQGLTRLHGWASLTCAMKSDAFSGYIRTGFLTCYRLFFFFPVTGFWSCGWLFTNYYLSDTEPKMLLVGRGEREPDLCDPLIHTPSRLDGEADL